ncbi:hypothetical protein ACSXBY_11065 [Clostridium perfringens]|uniref:hypothetical protein n=1 Tax=Clostridium perfringens TaxID=1502 RepID=UPI0005A7481B|nr:hypothetical protein [Clostridium perfringens]ELC8421254.1 hypothetical protein [Clostridium perfringens]MBI6028958.1 hypothetical protein [Clostridium perfringens]MBI6031991.1 hypothetical protein [Clostridium perfringens]MBI6066903.1 hypothetical protein [Clostridium perfringens]MDV5111361.1 hypothetical protein [Clostridium perfringens]
MKERINFKILNQAAWLSLVLTFIIPYELSSSGFKTWGYLVKYFTTYEFPQDSTTLLSSTSTNLLGLISNILVIYIIINIFILLKERLKKYKS